jgi:spore coat polysaccharide biosynthesis protein SpsF
MRRLVAVLAVRNNGTRLYGKPLQQLDDGVTILSQSVAALQAFSCVDAVVIAAAEGLHNTAYVSVARELGCGHVVGSENDVLGRVLAGARLAEATDVLRKTSEDPFFDYAMLEPAWARHLQRSSDATVLDHVPEGCAFELLTVAALERSHAQGDPADREHVADYVRFRQEQFRVDILGPKEPECRRLDLRLTVDQPEDLIVARAVYRELRALAPHVPLARIIELLDARPDLTALNARFSHGAPVWDGVPQRAS